MHVSSWKVCSSETIRTWPCLISHCPPMNLLEVHLLSCIPCYKNRGAKDSQYDHVSGLQTHLLSCHLLRLSALSYRFDPWWRKAHEGGSVIIVNGGEGVWIPSSSPRHVVACRVSVDHALLFTLEVSMFSFYTVSSLPSHLPDSEEGPSLEQQPKP